jgi:hypothetical protein
MRGVKPEFPSPARSAGKHFRIPQVPIEWLDASSWRLPSGKALAEFALQTGFLAPLLFRTRGIDPRAGSKAARKSKEFEKEGNR